MRNVYFIIGAAFKDNFKILLDMGFESKHIVAALRNTTSLELAMDYILNSTEATQMTESLLCEESSLTENAQSSGHKMETDSCDITNNSAASEPTSTPPTASSSGSTKTSKVQTCPSIDEFFLLTDDVFYKFCEEVIRKIFELMSTIPDIIASGAELIYILYSQSRPQAKEVFTTSFAKELKIMCSEISHILGQAINTTPDNLDSVINGAKASKLLTHLKVYTMLFDEKYSELRKDFSKALADNQALNSMVTLLSQTEVLLTNQQQLLNGAGSNGACGGIQKFLPNWLHFVIDFIDKCDVVSNVIQQKINTFNLIGNDWRWYDMSCGKWNTYSDMNNAIIRNAFRDGERTVNISIGRQRYTINFNTMTQISESYGSHRPISPSLELTDIISSVSKEKTGGPSAYSSCEAICTHILCSVPDNQGNLEEGVICKSSFNLNDITDKRDEKKSGATNMSSNSKNNRNSDTEGKSIYTFYTSIEMTLTFFCLKEQEILLVVIRN